MQAQTTNYIDAAYLASFLGKGVEKRLSSNGYSSVWLTVCPIHSDDKPSLTITEYGKTMLLFCHPCGKGNQNPVIDYLKQAYVWPVGGIIGNDLFDPNRKNNQWKDREEIWNEKWLEPQKTHDYRKANGELSFQMVRLWDHKVDKKIFEPYRKTPGGNWLLGIKGKEVEVVPYHLPQVLRAAHMGQDVCLFEGETNCDDALEDGIISSCNPFGAGKWDDIYTHYFKDVKKVYSCYDNDKAGIDHLNKVGASFQKAGIKLWVIELPGVEEKEDYSDWRENFPGMFDALKPDAKLWEGPIPNPFNSKPGKPSSTILELLPPIEEEEDNVVPFKSRMIALYERQTDEGNALLFTEMHGAKVRYSKSLGWLIDQGERWTQDQLNRVLEMAKDSARAVSTERWGDLKARSLWVQKSLNMNRLNAALACAAPKLAVDAKDFDCHNEMLNTRSGVVNLRTGEVLPHGLETAAMHFMRITDCGIDKVGVPIKFNKFMHSITRGDPARIEALKRIAGYLLLGTTALRYAFFIWGPGTNGKSIWIDTMADMLGSDDADSGYATTVRKEMFIKSKFESHMDNFSTVFGKRMCAVTELGQGDWLEESKVKGFTGASDRLVGRYMRMESFKWINTCKVVFRCNHMPQVADTDYAIWNRILKIPFDVTIPPEDICTTLFEDMKSEWSMIMWWRIQGAMAVLEEIDTGGLVDPLRIPKEWTDLTKAYQNKQNTLAHFFDEYVEDYKEYYPDQAITDLQREYWSVSEKDFNKAYSKYCQVFNHKPKTGKRLQEDMAGRGYVTVQRKNGWYYTGFKLRNVFASTASSEEE